MGSNKKAGYSRENNLAASPSPPSQSCVANTCAGLPVQIMTQHRHVNGSISQDSQAVPVLDKCSSTNDSTTVLRISTGVVLAVATNTAYAPLSFSQ